MPNLEDKLSLMSAEMTAEVTAAAEALRAETEAEERRQLEEYETALRQSYEMRRNAAATDAQNREDRRIVAESLRLRRELLEARESCAAALMSDVRERLNSLTASPEYSALMARQLRRALSAVRGAREAVLLLRPRDMHLAPELTALGGDTALKAQEGAFNMGGLILDCAELHRRVDLSFDSALTDIEGRFTELTGFHMEGYNVS